MNDKGPGRFKTLHLTNYYHKNSGGISTSFNNLLAAAERHERQVRLVVPGETEAVEDVNPYARIYFVPARRSPVFDKRYRIMMPWQYMLTDSSIRKILLDEMPDLIEVTDKYTLSMMGVMIRTNNFKKLGRPILVHFSCERMDDNVGSFISRSKVGAWLATRVVSNYLMPSFDYHIANSAYTADEFREAINKTFVRNWKNRFFTRSWRFFKAPRIPVSERIFVCPRGVNSEHYRPERRSADLRRQMIETSGVPSNSTILLYAGRLSPEKNIGLLVDIMKELAKSLERDVRLLVAGDGPQRDWLTREGIKLGENKIILLGHLDRETLADYYANADIFIHPNPKEPFGIAPLEAMASGTPTIAPRAGGILSYATDDNAWLVEPTAMDFARAIYEILSDDIERTRRTENAVRTALENTREKATDRLFETYDRIYEDFHSRKELFTDVEKAAVFDYTEIADA